MSNVREEVLAVAARAKAITPVLAGITRAEKDAALSLMADALVDNTDRIIQANDVDVESARANGTSEAIIDRLTLNPERIAVVAQGLREVAELDDPVGDVVRSYTVPNGLRITQRRVPFGVICMIYEARPNVTVDAAGLCLKSGNAALLRGSSSALHTNVALVDVMRSALESTNIPVDAIQLVPGDGHDAVKFVLTARGLVDLIIPRGGAGLINAVVEGSTVPVIETGVGNCHVYVDASADVDMAIDIVLNSKTQRVSVCNAAETLVVHQDIAEEFLPRAMSALKASGVTVHGDAAIATFAKDAGTSFEQVTDEDLAAEYYSLDLAALVVPDLDSALEHIRMWSTGHTEAIVSTDPESIKRFSTELDSAVIMVNASTRFTDGAEFGFGAEIGISTQKMHARGPMGLAELTSMSYVVEGTGQTRN